MIDKDGLNWEVSVGVTYASLMSAVSLFFTGMLISQYKSFNPTIKVPLIFLIISTFSFIFAATIYSNAGTEITLNKLRVTEKYMIYGKNIVELLGLYLFILATPLVIGSVTQDSFLRTTTILVAISGFALYSQSKFSVLEKELAGNRKRYLSATIVILALSLYYFQVQTSTDSLIAYSTIAIGLVLILLTSTYLFCTRSKQYKPISFRPYEEADADALSAVILKNLARVKERSYSREIMDQVKKQSTPSAVRELAKHQAVYVAELDSRVVGLAALKGEAISSVFTDPSLHRKGIGRMIIDYVEKEAAAQGLKSTTLMASTLDHDFYKKLGYRDVQEIGDEKTGKGLLMRKHLQP